MILSFSLRLRAQVFLWIAKWYYMYYSVLLCIACITPYCSVLLVLFRIALYCLYYSVLLCIACITPYCSVLLVLFRIALYCLYYSVLLCIACIIPYCSVLLVLHTLSCITIYYVYYYVLLCVCQLYLSAVIQVCIYLTHANVQPHSAALYSNNCKRVAGNMYWSCPPMTLVVLLPQVPMTRRVVRITCSNSCRHWQRRGTQPISQIWSINIWVNCILWCSLPSGKS